MRRIEKSEIIVRHLFGVRQVRVRDFDKYARIEVDKNEMNLLRNEKKILILERYLKALGFETILIDSDGYRPGKLNVIID